MNLRTFIERPVFSAVISITIVILGIIGLFTLPVEQYPDIAPPTVMVSTTYYGASAETLQKSVIAPLEEAINGVEDMTYMTSTATNAGSVSITVYFKQGTDPDMAAVNVQNRVSRATGQLPGEVTQVGVTTMKRQTSILQMFSLHSPDNSYDENFLANYMSINLKPQLLRIAGVGDMMIMGGDYSMRVWMKPDVMAQYKLIPSDVTAALAEQNIESATGSFGENSDETYQYTMKYKGRLITPEEFGEIVIRSTEDGEVLKLKDIADVELGKDSYAYKGGMDGHNGVSCMVFQTAGSNATEVNQNIDNLLDEVRKDLPKGVELTQMMSSNDFLFASIHEVVKTLIEAIILVILVVYVFLQDIRSTLIPLVGIIVSLVGTFAFMSVAGFSINLITLFALVLVIGTVVDDAIVVVEAVQSRFDVGYKSSYMASIDAMKGISNAVITSSLVFMAVFIPVSFMSGTSGTFYTQFGLTMAVAVGISAVNALTLSPALCALLLRPYINEDGTQKNNFAARFRNSFNAAFDVVVNKYKNVVLFFIKRRWLSWSLLVCSVVVLVLLMNSTKTSLVPDEDQGVLFVNVSTAPGSSLKTTDDIMLRVEERLEAIPQKLHIQKVTGYGLLSGQGNTFGMIVVKLKPWDERTKKEDQVQAVIGQIYARTADIKDATIFAIAPGMIPGYGMGNALDLNVQDKLGTDVNTFFQTTQQYLGALNQRPEISMAYSTFDVRYPQWTVEVDAAKCKRAGITPDAVLSTLSGYYGGQYVSNFNRFSKVYRVMIQSGPEYRMDETSLHNTFVRMANGEMAPLSQFVTLTRSYGAETLSRFNMYNSIAVNAMPAEGYSTGDAIRAVKETAEISLPKGYGYDFGGITREENQQSGTTVIIFGICILMIYLILSALYESFIVPFAVILAVPVGLMGTFLFAKIAGLENNIYLQTGLIMLIGLLAKTAILLTEYAAERRKAGMGLIASAVSAAKARLRPILMTALTMIFGLFPLVVATGVGANGNRSLGTGVVGGMTIGTLALLFIVPALFVTFQWLQERLRPAQSMPTKDWQIEEEMEVSKKEIEEHTIKRKMKKQIITLAVAALLLSSCGIYTKYERPEVKTDGLYGQDVEVEDTTSIASLSWRELFTDPQLQSLIEHALQGNTDLQSAQWRIKEAEATLSSARLAYLPSFMLTPQGGVSSFDKSKGSWTYSGIASASWEIDIFGKLTNAKRRAKALYLQSLEYEQAVTTSLIANVANMYYTLLMLDAQYNVSAETAAKWRESVKTMRAMKAAGMTDEAGVAQTEANCYMVEASLLDLKQQIREVENSLSILLGDVPDAIERGKLQGQSFPEELTVGVPLQLLSRRPDVKSAELSLAQAFYSTNAARSAFYPSITLGGTAGWTNSAGSMIINPGKLLLSAVGSLTQPLFNKGLNMAQLKIAKAQQEEAKLSFQQALLNAGSEVNNALTQVQVARGKTELRDGQITSLETAVRSTQLLMKHGNSTYLEVLTAQQSLLSAQLTQIADRFDEIQGIINLYQALGGGRE